MWDRVNGISPYTGLPLPPIKSTGTITGTDIEHVVAKSEAADSGGCGWTPETKNRYANDMLNLTVATRDLNRGWGDFRGDKGKNDKDAGEWQPPQVEPRR